MRAVSRPDKFGVSPRKRWLVVLAAGILLVFVAVLLGGANWTATYAHTAEISDYDSEPEISYEELSPRAKRTVEQALDADSQVRRSKPLEDFTYSPAVGGGESQTIAYQGQTVRVNTEEVRDRPAAVFVGSVRLSALLTGGLLTVLGGLSLVAGRHRVLNRLATSLRTWAPFPSFLVLELPFVPVLFVAGIGPWLAVFGSLHGWKLVAAPLFALCVGFGGIAASTVVFLRAVDIEPIPFAVSVLLVPAVWAAVVWVVIADGVIVGTVLYYQAGTAVAAIVGHSIGWDVHAWLFDRSGE
jgi:hypothetical protein